MKIIDTGIADLFVIEPKVFNDDRGYFFESFNASKWPEHIAQVPFVQDNEAYSSKGVLRGLHYQIPPFGQAKLVRVVSGEVLDVVVDIRPKSPTFGKTYSVRLTGENKKQMYVPRGFAHGYVVLSDTAIFSYKCDNYYSKAHEGGVYFNDDQLNIDWQFDLNKVELSEKDKSLPPLGSHRPYKLEE